MTWWLWILFWVVFWTVAFAYLAWRTWRLWPHAREFGRTCTTALERLDEARALASQRPSTTGGAAPPARGGEHRSPLRESTSSTQSGVLVPAADAPSALDDVAWNTPASEWRARRRSERRRRRDLRLDDHTAVWASWHDPLE